MRLCVSVAKWTFLFLLSEKFPRCKILLIRPVAALCCKTWMGFPCLQCGQTSEWMSDRENDHKWRLSLIKLLICQNFNQPFLARLMAFIFCCRAKIYGKMLREKVLKMFKTLYKIQIKNNAFAVFNHLLSMIIHVYSRKRGWRRRWINTRNQHFRKPFTLVKSSLSQLKSKAFSRKLLWLIAWCAVFFSILNVMHWKSERYSLQDSSKTHNKTVVMYSTHMECTLHTSTAWNM